MSLHEEHLGVLLHISFPEANEGRTEEGENGHAHHSHEEL